MASEFWPPYDQEDGHHKVERDPHTRDFGKIRT
jgi:hypothetical protein